MGPSPRLWLAVARGASRSPASCGGGSSTKVSSEPPQEAAAVRRESLRAASPRGAADPQLLDRAPALFARAPSAAVVPRRRVGPTTARPHLVMGFALGGWAVAVQGSPPTVVVGWTALSWPGSQPSSRAADRSGRIAALALALLAFP